MRLLLLGRGGQLGWELHRTLSTLGEVLALDYPEIDLRQPEGLRSLVHELRPQVIVNAAAYTAVDRAESEAQAAWSINAQAAGNLADAARQEGAALVHYSTDYVFDGTKGSPYQESDLPNPLNSYGRSKLAGEQAIQQAGGAYLILRTAWVYSLRQESFVSRVLQWARQSTRLSIVDDQVSNPTWARTLAEATAQVLALGAKDVAGWLRERGGLYHLAGDGWASRLEWAQAILQTDPQQAEQVVREVLPARSADFPSPAQRPLFSALDCRRFSETFNLRLPDWRLALRLAFDTA